MDSSIKHQGEMDIVFVLLQHVFLLGGKNITSIIIIQVVRQEGFHGQGLLQHCRDKGDDYHSATLYYLTNLFNNKSRLAQTTLNHGINDQLRLTAEENSVRYFQDNKATDTNGDPSKDSKHVADVENSIVDEPDGIFNNVEVNTAVAVRYDADLGQMANLKLIDKRVKELVEMKLQVLA
jgi:hypothetical protein